MPTRVLKIAWCSAALLALAGDAPAQAPATPPERPVPYPVVPPSGFERAVERGTRSPDGMPGRAYWQQWTDYTLRARLDPAAKRLTGRATIVYHNRSPSPLPLVVLHLFQNLHAPGVVRNESQEVTGGVELTRVTAQGARLEQRERLSAQRPGYIVDGTIMRLRPAQSVRSGDSLVLQLEWAFTVPQSGAGRMGWDGDDLFHIAYWYPQLAVFDDFGWHQDPYLGQAEFYVGFGRYDVTIEAPEGWVVMATGRLQNPEEVLAEPVLRRFRAAERSDTVVHVLTPDDFGPGRATRRAPGGSLRWRFTADTVRDVAFSATRASRWDAARTPVGDRDGDGATDYARVDAFWRPSAPRWANAWRYAQHSIEFLSRWTGVPYPWPHMTAVEGGGIIGGGMEFPMMTLIGDYNQRGDSALYYVVAHELAHMWVPMIVGTDETHYAWMDEGTTTFNENQARKEFFPGATPELDERNGYLAVARAGLEGEVMRWSDYHYPGPAYGTASYSKPATLLATLRALLGEETFTRGYRTYLRSWKYKHPKPWDFFNALEAAAGRDLDWFWRSWYYETWLLDQAVGAVTPRAAAGAAAAAAGTTTIVVEDRGNVPMPARLTITLASGDVVFREIPVEIWLAGRRSAEVTVEGSVVRVEIDADEAFPDADRGNNVWVRGRE